MVTANSGDNNVSLLLGAGNNGFVSQTTYATGLYPFSVAAGDFNRDGKLDGSPDLVTANLYGNDVSVLMGLGNGTFATQITYAVGSNPRSLALDDFNGDGRLDVVVTNNGSNDISVLIGLGDGTFTPQTRYAVGVSPFSVAAGDFNNDGLRDVAVTNATSDVSVLLGVGNGTFAAQAKYAVGDSPYTVVLGDFNGDGRLDIATANYSGNDVSVLVNQGKLCGSRF